jgi:RHS repeat-associated protein
LTAGTTVNEFRYVGELGYLYDMDIRKYFLRARFLDPTSGRFLSRDVTTDRGPSNTYAYVNNQPLRNVDPSGWAAIACGGSSSTTTVVLGALTATTTVCSGAAWAVGPIVARVIAFFGGAFPAGGVKSGQALLYWDVGLSRCQALHRED